MAQIGTLTTGAGVSTVIAGQSQCDQYIVIGDVDTPLDLQAVSVEIEGTPFIQIVGQNLVEAFAQYKSNMGGTDGTDNTPSNFLKIATGFIPRNTTFRFTNNGNTTPAIYAFSTARAGIPLIATTQQINATSYQVFTKFSALIIDNFANVLNVEISFRDGSKSTLTIPEVDAMFTLNNPASPAGKLGPCSCIDNSDQSISSVRINTGAGAATVLTVKLPDESFRILNQ